MKKTIYIIFDIFYDASSGGLVATYQRMVNLLSKEYQFKIISVFNYGSNVDDRFPGVEIINLSKMKLDINLSEAILNLKKGHIFKSLNIFLNVLIYFFYAPIARIKIRKKIDNEVVICVSPAAAFFMPRSIDFILEIHTQFEYFFGNNRLGSIQGKLMRKPKLVIFRTKADMEKGKQLFNSDYLYNFFDDSMLKKEKSIGLEIRKNKIIFIGRFSKAKNLPKMIACAEKLREIYPDFQLDMYGTGDQVELIKQLIKQNKLENNVHLCGFCNDKNIYDQYSLQWLTSDYEGLSLVLVEALANGVPTVSTNWGEGVFEVISNGENGYIENTIDSFVEKTVNLLTNQELLTEISVNALNSFELFSKENAYKKWTKILEEFETDNS